MSPSYSLRIDFARNVSNPERVFNSMGLLVEGFDKLHSSILLGFGTKIEFSSALSETRKGSIIADIKHKVIDKVRGVNFKSICDAIYRGLEEEIAITKKIDSESDVRLFAEKIYSQITADKVDLDEFTCESNINLYEIAEALHKINNALNLLSEEDKAQFGKKKKFVDISDEFSCPRPASQMFENVEMTFPCREVVIIRRPSYVFGLNWDLESNSRKFRKFSAKMSDEVWFESWKNHDKDAQLWPGDGLLADIKTTKKVNKHRHTTSIECKIIKVVRVIPQEKVKQTELDLSDE
ncbi:hypothetical protein [Pseudoalteromonas sp. HL-AS1]|uniref:hypothetical protein n=2 Tax=unclassified Pseudoalteromonas TaxID=194690 RepID=UPI002814A6DC|nr:hypothetical protein [Pseudoalteromonas sp. HL-AS1]WMS92054.1 hypothetical protein RB214_06685 [Pseudoalteromonas sp. HL-AS1]